MDRHGGLLPPSTSSLVPSDLLISGHPSHRLSSEELKEFVAKQKVSKLYGLAQDVIHGDERVLVSDTTFKELSNFSVTKPVVDFDDYFELQDQQRHDSYFAKS